VWRVATDTVESIFFLLVSPLDEDRMPLHRVIVRLFGDGFMAREALVIDCVPQEFRVVAAVGWVAGSTSFALDDLMDNRFFKLLSHFMTVDAEG